MILWGSWPSFCGALVAPAALPATVLGTDFAMVLLRKQIRVADIANTTLAAGVAIVAGLITGKVLSLFSRKDRPYEDEEEFLTE